MQEHLSFLLPLIIFSAGLQNQVLNIVAVIFLLLTASKALSHYKSLSLEQNLFLRLVK